MSICLDDSLKNALDAEGICDSKRITQRHVFDDYTEASTEILLGPGGRESTLAVKLRKHQEVNGILIPSLQYLCSSVLTIL